MTRLDKLIQDLCLDGVKTAKIGSVVEYEQPTKYIVSSTNYDGAHETPVLTAGQTFILGYTDETDGVYYASEEKPVIIFDDFTGAFKWVDFPFKVKSSAMKMLTVSENSTSLRYIYHVMGKLNFVSSEHKRLWIGTYSEFEIPLPPLPVQQEIVRILDNFTELTAELTARKKQYEFYQDKLIQELCLDGAEYRTLPEIFHTRNGYTPSKSKKEFWENETIPWFRMEDIRENGHILSEVSQHITEEAVKGTPFPENSFIVAMSATIGEHTLITVPSLANQRFTYLILKDEYKNKFIIKFLYYYWLCC